MLEHVAITAPPRGDLTDTAWSAWRVGLLEAIGTLRDPRSAAVLTAILDSAETDPMIVKAAAEALGKLGTDTAVQKLLAMSKSGPKSRAVLAGMGHCRRAAIADALAKVIATKPDADTARVVLKSLGDVGSAAAWATTIVQVSGEEAATRAAAAKALVGAFVAYEGDLRKLAQAAILVVDDPSTPNLIASAKQGASPSLAAALDKLAAKLADNPTR
jgi:HEAT repeat protein